MTPLTRIYARYLPRRLVWLAVTLTYATALAAIVFFGEPVGDDIVYIDLN